DNVIDMNRFPIPKITEMVTGNRKIGLGVMGWADMLIKLRIPYNSEEAIHLGEKLMCFINCEAKKTSHSLALERGAFPNFKSSVYDDGRSESLLRNATVTTIAPTGTISIIGGCSSGIEPLFAISFLRKTPQFELLEVNPLFEEVARKEGFYTPELMMKIARRGSIRDLEEVPEHIRKVFITAMDLNADDHVKMQAAFQRHTDNAVSKTVNFPFTATVEEVTNVFLLAHHLGCKGITIYRDGSRDVQVLNVKREEHKEGHKSGLGNTASSSIPPTANSTPPQPEILRVGAEFSGGCAKCNI
ncbi:MAG: ribonucleotide-diphosphate reductase subunit alpha, partial [Nanoarchaeota archaeon]